MAEFAELLRGSYYARNGSFGAVLELMSESGTAYKKRPDFKEIYRTVSMAQGLGAVRTLNQLNE